MRFKHNKTASRVLAALNIGLLGFLVVQLFAKFAPFNMDEFNLYHTIICHYYPANMLNTFREGCSIYDLNFLNLGIILPMRVYAYMGSFPNLYYYPLFLLWKSPDSARFVGYLFLVMQAVLLQKLCGIRFKYALLTFVLFFPYLFLHIVDTGTVSVQTTAVFALYFCLKKWIETGRHRYSIIIPFIVAAAFWTKIVFAWLVPALAVVFAALVIEHQKKYKHTIQKKRLAYQLTLCTVLTLALVGSVMLSTHPKDSTQMPFLGVILHQEEGRSIVDIGKDFTEIPALQKMVNPFYATERIYNARSHNIFTTVYATVMLSIVPLFIAAGLWQKKTRVAMKKPILMFVCFAITLFIIVRTKSAVRMHHVVLAYPFLLLSGFYLYQTFIKHNIKTARVYAASLGCFAVLNLAVFVQFPSQELHKHDDPSKVTIQKVLNDPVLAKKYFYVVLDWGMYYYQGLYGPKEQSVLYMEPLNEKERIMQLRKLAKEHDRQVLFIHRKESSSDLKTLHSIFRLTRCANISPELEWQISLQTSRKIGDTCVPEDQPYKSMANR